jgi:PAS domain S-box-containing protein
VRIDSIDHDTRFPHWRAGALERGLRGAAALPVLEAGVIVGAFVVYSDQANVFTSEVMELLSEVAADVGFALETIAGREGREEAEARLAASERRYRLLFERNLAGVYRTTLDGEILECNDAFAAMFGFDSRDELLAVHANETYGDPADREAFLAALHEHGELRSFEHVGRRKDGAPVTMLENASLVEGEDGETIIEGSTIDITEHTRAQEQLQQAQKLEAVGQLAGGVAHDFNNLLQAAIGSAQRLKIRADDPAAVRDAADQMTGVLERGAALTRQLLLFARRQTTDRQPCELNRVIHDAATMLSRLLRETIELRLELTDQPLWLHADRGQLGQIIVNLAVNAADAMPRGGVLVVRTRPSDNQHVRLEVEDTGSGMAADVQDRLFEPFFTTKDRGKGTGLGLAVVHGIVTSHDGRISVDSSEGHGTRFTIELPGLARSDDPCSGEPDEEPSADEQELPEGNGQRLLVVDDDEGVLEAVAEMLEGLGYEVATATTAADAEKLAGQQPFDLLLSDVVLPTVSGPELAQQLRRRVTGLRVVLMSGYSEDQALDAEIETGHALFLTKPFTGERLAEVVHEALALEPLDLDQ